ncbi:flavodoxin domain-containing protein [Clostridium sp. OS1-26]|uniref:flavodoxin domain-containing protein n=1 Tax=Clostridium sp. OS1-26 TaxID=3070681 RepID=UPI0027E17AB0|nr:flavodoxin domain-containing protein [Clostridium sp. OS1-26]WML33364.1 flavodoxin domain-containing protein [Clostridium sp. OS1-26]
MKSIVIYKSQTGFTKKYAEWIAEELGADIFHVSEANVDMLKNYDTVTYGGGLYASGINGVKFITENSDSLKGKKVIVFATGASVGRAEEIEGVRNKNFTAEQQGYIKFFYLRGGFNYKKLSPLNKILMTFLKWKLKTKKDLTADEKGMLAAYDHPMDFVKKKNIQELVTYAVS